MTLEELEFLRCIADDDTILKTYKQLKVEGKTHEEIAEILGKDVSWISKNKNRLISKLKIILFSDDVLKEIFG